jgi:hypothetical protein
MFRLLRQTLRCPCDISNLKTPAHIHDIIESWVGLFSVKVVYRGIAGDRNV